MMSDTKVTVLLPVFNGENHLHEAISSILSQTFYDFELLIINDGSTDRSETIINSFSDKRIKYVCNTENIGLIRTLNKGLDLIDSEYIVRMDADDISYPDRLQKQICFMNENPHIAVSGTSIRLFGNNTLSRNYRVRVDPSQIKTELIFKCALMHPTVIIRNRILKLERFYYDENHHAAEDFGLWQKISFKYALGNIEDVLLKYRINPQGITQINEKNIEMRDQVHMKIYQQGLSNLGLNFTEEQLRLYRLFVSGRVFSEQSQIEDISKVLELIRAQIKLLNYDMKTFENVASGLYRLSCTKSNLSYNNSVILQKKYFSDIFKYQVKDKIKYFCSKYILKSVEK